MPADQWQALVDTGHVASTIKGNPSKVHARMPGAQQALCKHEPGESRPYGRMKKRSGWMYWPKGEGPVPNCAKCIEASAPKPAEKTWPFPLNQPE